MVPTSALPQLSVFVSHIEKMKFLPDFAMYVSGFCWIPEYSLGCHPTVLKKVPLTLCCVTVKSIRTSQEVADTKMIFLPQMDKVGFCRGASEQNINSCLKWSKRVQMGPKGSQVVKKNLFEPLWTTLTFLVQYGPKGTKMVDLSVFDH